MIYQVFSHEQLITVGTARRYALAKTFGVIGRSLVQVKLGNAYRFLAGCAEEVLGVPGGIQGREVVPTNGLAACFTDRLG